MIGNTYIRRALGILLGGLSGASLCLSILPLVMQMIGAGAEISVAYRLSPYLIYTALVWAAGGWSVTRTVGPLPGGLTLAIVGLVTGLLLAWFGLGHEARLLAGGAFGGLVYGFLGGLILGQILIDPASIKADEE